MQSAKIIDIKRSFVPVDANAFPETLHLDTKEDFPENKVPVVPYIGHNFLPTAHGYKSFFGTNSKLGINSLAPNKADHIFIYQTLAYKNVLIALCDTGIWAKLSTSAGAWTQLVVMAAPGATVYYEWFTAVISNKLYIFRGNGTAFYRIDTDVGDPLGIDVVTLTPNFITIADQLGMFRLGSRIGFWDASNAIAWSSPDNFEDFTPSVLTGANVTTFNAVLGKISNIRPHGKDAICYASKSVVHLAIQPAETFLVKASAILKGAGVPYARQSIEGVPDTTHFCYSSAGIYKIENGTPEVIVPELFDYFKPYTAQPVYLKLLQGRYLCFEILDENLITGNPLFSEGSYDVDSLTFPGYTSLASAYAADADDLNMCEIMSMIDEGTFSETQAQAAADLPDKKPGTTAEPVWTCYLSNNGLKDLSNLTWDSTPCGNVAHTGAVWHMSPNVPVMGTMTTDSTNKTAKTGAEAYVDGKWTMERFIATQTAIWETEESILSALIAEIVGRNFSVSTVTPNINTCVVSTPAFSFCDVGEFVSQYSPHKFGYNTCSFWLTRFALESKVVKTKSRTTIACDADAGTQVVAPYAYQAYNDGDPVAAQAATPEAALIAWQATGYELHYSGIYNAPTIDPGSDAAKSNGTAYAKVVGGAVTDVEIKALYQTSDAAARHLSSVAGDVTNPWGVVTEQYSAGYTTKTETSVAINEATTNSGVLDVETAYCVITGWNYTKNDGTTAFAASSACTMTDNKYPGQPTGTTERKADPDIVQPDLVGDTGTVCNIEFVAPLSPAGVSFPDENLEYPAGTFLLQDGSIAPKYPTLYGAFVYDLHLKKWGKYKDTFKGLLDYSPLNSESSSPVSTANFGMLAGSWKEDGFIYIFDDVPADSLLTWGKIGYYRAGMTDIQEVTFHFKEPATGSLIVDLSLDGRSISTPSSYEEEHELVREKTIYPPNSGRWYNISITGKFDVTDILTKGMGKGRR